MDKLIIGRYIVGDSFIHRLDPRSKLLAMLIYIIVIFWANNPVTYAVITLFTLYPVSSFLQYKRECALVHRIF